MKFIIKGIYDNQQTQITWDNGNIICSDKEQQRRLELLYLKYAGKSLWHESERWNHKGNFFDSYKIISESFTKTTKAIMDKEAMEYFNSYKIDELQGRKPMSNINKTCKPRGGEKQSAFISRCIKEQMGKGKTQDEAKGMCYGIWRGEKAKQGIFKSLNMALNRIVERALPAGTRRQRSDGTYVKQPDGTWLKEKEKKQEIKPGEFPKNLRDMTKVQETKFVNYLVDNFSEKQLDKRIKLIDAQIKRREDELTREGKDFRKIKDRKLENIWKLREMNDQARQEIRSRKIK